MIRDSHVQALILQDPSTDRQLTNTFSYKSRMAMTWPEPGFKSSKWAKCLSFLKIIIIIDIIEPYGSPNMSWAFLRGETLKPDEELARALRL